MKRSAQVALVLMSAATVGGAGYAMMPRQSCVAPGGAIPNAGAPKGVTPKGVTPNGALPNALSPKGVAPNGVTQPCSSSRSSWSFRSGRPIFGMWNNSTSNGRTNFSSSNSGTSTSTTTTSRASIGGTTRGGFGGTSTAFASRGG